MSRFSDSIISNLTRLIFNVRQPESGSLSGRSYCLVDPMFPVSVKCKSDPWGEKVKRCAFTWLIARRVLRCRTPSIPTSLLDSPSVVSVYDEQRCNSRWITELEKMSHLLLDWFSMLEQDTERPHRRCCSGRDRVWSMSSKEFSSSMNSWQSERDVESHLIDHQGITQISNAGRQLVMTSNIQLCSCLPVAAMVQEYQIGHNIHLLSCWSSKLRQDIG